MSRCRQMCLVAFGALLAVTLIIVPVLAAPPGQSGGTTHVVSAGETLWSIAQKYGVQLADVLSANDIADANHIAVGQRLTIPGVAARAAVPRATAAPPAGEPTVEFQQTHVVVAGESLGGIATRYRTTVSELATVNGIADVDSLFVGQRLLVPGKLAADAPVDGFASANLPIPFAAIVLRDPKPQQGNTVLVTVETTDAVALSGAFDGQPVRFLDQGSHHWGLVPVGPMADVGPHDLTITASGGQGDGSSKIVGQVWVTPGKFDVEDIDLPADRQGLLDPKLVQAEAKRLYSALGDTDAAPLWVSRFVYPLAEHLITSKFGTRRSYNGGPVSGYHEGFDYDASNGTPVMAAADGRVVMAEKLTVRGNGILLDHGLGVHTGYWHLSKINVKVGEVVKAGEVIALAGGTGLATGPHLHWEIRVGQINVNPLQWIQQSFP